MRHRSNAPSGRRERSTRAADLIIWATRRRGYAVADRLTSLGAQSLNLSVGVDRAVQCQTTVSQDGLSGDPTHLEHGDDGLGDIIGLTYPAESGSLTQPFHPSRQLLGLGQHRGSGDARPHRVDSDAMRPPLACRDPDQHVYPGLGNAISAHVAVGDGAADAGHSDDGSATAVVDHRPRNRPHRQPGSGEVDVDHPFPVGGILRDQHSGSTDTGTRDQTIRHPDAGQGLLQRSRHCIGIADVAGDVAAAEIPRDDIVAGATQPVGGNAADAGGAAGDDGGHRAGPISSTRTPSGAVITAIWTCFPCGAGTTICRTPCVNPKSASRPSVGSTSRFCETRKNPGTGPAIDSRSGAELSNPTNSTMPVSGALGSPRKIDCRVSVLASNRVGQSPVNTWSKRTVRPRPSRQKASARSTSVVTITV